MSIFRRFLPPFLLPGVHGGVHTHPWLSGQRSRLLYTPAALGLDDYVKLREDASLRFANIQDSFKGRMRDLLSTQEQAMIFTEDFKNVLHLVDANEKDMELVREMARRFNRQHQGLRFGMYVFGPVVMRTYHFLKQPQEAFEALYDPGLAGFFDQLTSYQVAMDLLYKSGRFAEVLEVFKEVQEKRLAGAKYPKSCLNIAFAACYKMNTQDSLAHLQGLLEKMQEYGIPLNRKLLVFAASLALATEHPHTALDLVLRSKSITHITVRSIKVISLSQLGRVEEAILTLRSITEIDLPGPARSSQGMYILREALSAVEAALKDGSKEQQVEFGRIAKCLEEAGAISNKSLDEVVCQPIDKFEKRPGQDRAMLAASFSHNSRQRYQHSARPVRPTRRPGLMDME